MVPAGATTATLSVSRTCSTQTVAITVNGHADYLACRLHAGVAFTGVHQRVPPRPPQVIPPPTTQTAEEAAAAVIADAPPRPAPRPAEDQLNPDGSVNLYGPGGLLTPERRLAWLCWATFGTADGC